MHSRIKPPANAPGPNAKPGAPLNIVYRRIEELRPDPANPRRHTKKQIRQIAHSIKTFGFNVPILVDRDGKIIAGHGKVRRGPPARHHRSAELVPRSPHRGAGPRVYDRR